MSTSSILLFFLQIPRTPKPTLFPYTTLFRSLFALAQGLFHPRALERGGEHMCERLDEEHVRPAELPRLRAIRDRKSTRLNSSHITISYAVFCLKKKK